MTIELGGVCSTTRKFSCTDWLLISVCDQLNVLQHFNCSHCKIWAQVMFILGPLRPTPTLVDAARCIIPYWVHAPYARTIPSSSNFTCLLLNAQCQHFFSLLAGRSTKSIVPKSTSKCELQFLYPSYDSSCHLVSTIPFHRRLGFPIMLIWT